MTVDIFMVHSVPHKNMPPKKVSKYKYIYILITIVTIDKISRLKKFPALQLPNHTKN